MSKTIYQKIKNASSPLKDHQPGHESEWKPTDEKVVNSAGELLSNAQKKVTPAVEGQEAKPKKTLRQAYDDALKLGYREESESFEDYVIRAKQDDAFGTSGQDEIIAKDEIIEYKGDQLGKDPVDPVAERKRYNPGYFETLNKNLAEGAARRGSKRDTKRAIKDLKSDLTRQQKKDLREAKKTLKNDASGNQLKGRGSSRDIQLMQKAGIAGSEKFGVTNVEAARGKLDKTSDQFKSRVEGQTMDKSAGQLGNTSDKVIMEKAKKGSPGTEDKLNQKGTALDKNKYNKNKSPFKMGGYGSKNKK
tara:strand:+ start:81 stop:992 length:912 start_codon:yes stop_codon:yes gene_type:complete